MKILIIPSWFKSYSYPNVGVFFWEEAIGYSKKGYDVTIFNVTTVGKKDYLNYLIPRLNFVQKDNIKIYEFVTPSFGLNFLEKLFEYIFYIKILILISFFKIEMNFDYIHAHSFFLAGITGVKLSLKYQLPVIVTEQASILFEEKISKRNVDLLKNVVENTTKFICVSNALREKVQEITNTEREIFVLPYMVNNLFRYKSKEKTENFHFLCVANLNANKRVDLLIKSFYEAFKNVPNVYLSIGGDGVQKEYLERLITSFDFKERIKLLGSISREEVRDLNWNCNVFVLPSFFETFGIVYIEALACGNPIIGVRNGGANDIINNSNGIIVERDNKKLLSEAMLKIYKNYEWYNLKEISQKCIESFGEENHYIIIEKIIM